jgi:hypothetical protein
LFVIILLEISFHVLRQFTDAVGQDRQSPMVSEPSFKNRCTIQGSSRHEY